MSAAAATPVAGAPSRLKLALAFAAIYVFWGSTYLAIRIAIQTLPPFWMAASRFLVAGSVLYLWARRRGAPSPSRVQWRAAAIVGLLLLLGGNGGVVWAEQRVPSGLAALIVALVPLWMVLLDGAGRGWQRPPSRVLVGIGLGLVGVGLLVGPGHFAGGHGVDPLGAAALVVGTLSWATGSLYARRAALPAAPLLATAMEMLAGGVGLAVAGALNGEWHRLDLATVSVGSLLAVGYLIVAGSLIGFTAYVWLLRVSTPPLVATYAYVNPVVAVLLGWAILGEPVTGRTLLAAAIIVGAVVLITTHRAVPRATAAAKTPSSAPPLASASDDDSREALAS